jgi:hypothetical protein
MPTEAAKALMAITKMAITASMKARRLWPHENSTTQAMATITAMTPMPMAAMPSGWGGVMEIVVGRI